ncbi:MAG: DegT/DnrJ/EryC1/StrS family aminotransferase [Anaerolineales bacterium]|nr:DegT/DnrJ/EryC1/StrS family aminotransferase [Anaerolineales bacterium]
MTTWEIPLADIKFDRSEIDAVVEVLQSGWLTMGSATQQFEANFSEWNNVPHSIAVSSGTAALHLACIAGGLGPGDEVVLPALTFVATANAVRYTGATPVFADIQSLDDLTISPESIRSKITSNTKAIIVMHYAGYPCQMAEIQQIAYQHNLLVIEDAAHAIGAELNGKMMGTVGDIGCFSFFSNKNLVTGEGGMITTRDPEIAQRLRHLRSHGMSTLTWDRHKGHAFSYDVVDLGYNYRLDEIRAALGISQLNKLAPNNQIRRSLTRYYHHQLAEKCPQITVPFSDHPGTTAAHIMPVLLPENIHRQSVMEHLKANRIQTSIHYPPITGFSNYREEFKQRPILPRTDYVAEKELTLPLFPTMTTAQIDRVVDCLVEGLERR